MSFEEKFTPSFEKAWVVYWVRYSIKMEQNSGLYSVLLAWSTLLARVFASLTESCAWKRLRLCRPSKKSRCWLAPTKIWKSATTLTSLSSLPSKRKSVTRCLRKSAKSPLSRKQPRKPSRSVTGPWSRTVMARERFSARPSTNRPARRNMSKSQMVSHNKQVTPSALLCNVHVLWHSIVDERLNFHPFFPHIRKVCWWHFMWETACGDMWGWLHDWRRARRVSWQDQWRCHRCARGSLWS